MSENLINENKLKCLNTITVLFEKYKDREYMLQRIHNHINNYLPNTLDNEYKNYEKRLNRNTFLTNEQQMFIQIFLSKNNYYYLPNNNLFYEYNGKNYFIVKEDDIIHKLLCSISKDKVLMQWKYKTKLNIIKQIKERSLLNSIPETDTIQNILNVLYPSIFSSKNAAKYFLTIIGDNIFKKNQNLIFLVNSQMKKFLNELDNIAWASIGYNNTTNNFMTKYHENHTFENCRLIKINEHFSNDFWRELLKKIGLDLMCVAAHYSKRYENSDKFMENKSDEDLKNYTYYLKNTNHNDIVKDFCGKFIIETNNLENSKMEWKNIHFVWKQFLSNYYLPNIIYSNSLKNILKELYIYDEPSDSFFGITSKYLPIQSDFLKFWESTFTLYNIEYYNTSLTSSFAPISTTSFASTSFAPTTFEVEIEIDEICSLFKFWSKTTSEQLMTNGNISEENVIKILKHFFPNIEIIEDKYILNVSCVLWNKSEDIDKSFEYIKEQIKQEYTLDLISFDEVYNYYYKFCSINHYKFIVSKRFFEKYLYFKLSDYIVYEKFIEKNWVLHH